MKRAVPFVTSVAFAFAAACSPHAEGGKASTVVEAGESAASDPAGTDSSADDSAPCPVIDSRNWHAWVDVMPGVDAQPRLHVSGEIDLPTADYKISWAEGAADRSAVPTQRLILTAEPPDGMAAQVVTAESVKYQGPAITKHYSSVIVLCGGEALVEMPDVSVTE